MKSPAYRGGVFSLSGKHCRCEPRLAGLEHDLPGLHLLGEGASRSLSVRKLEDLVSGVARVLPASAPSAATGCGSGNRVLRSGCCGTETPSAMPTVRSEFRRASSARSQLDASSERKSFAVRISTSTCSVSFFSLAAFFIRASVRMQISATSSCDQCGNGPPLASSMSAMHVSRSSSDTWVQKSASLLPRCRALTKGFIRRPNVEPSAPNQ